MMPRTLTLIRHGESESNLAKDASQTGVPLARVKELMATHTSKRRLTSLGVAQAQRAGEWMRAWITSVMARDSPETSFRFYVSPYVRAMETAAYLHLGVRWRKDVRLVERNWGKIDKLTFEERIAKFGEELKQRKSEAFFWEPEGGESLQLVLNRLRDFNTTLHRECGQKHVVCVGHGETFIDYRFLNEYWSPTDLDKEMTEQDPRTYLENCRIIQYTRENEDGSVGAHLARVRFISSTNPDDPKRNLGWQPIRRPLFSDDDLLAEVLRYPHFLI
jgi:NAD+ kinase